jgi:hypothetical protein
MSYQRGHGNNLIAGGKLWTLPQVDNFDAIGAPEVFFADLLQVSYGITAGRRLGCDVEPQIPFGISAETGPEATNAL